MVMNSAGNKKAGSSGLVRDGLARLVDELLAGGGVECGIGSDKAGERRNLQVGRGAMMLAPTMPMIARMIMP